MNTGTEEKVYDYTKHPDFQEYYDTTQKRHYWLLGYASNATIFELWSVAQKYAEKFGIDPLTCKCDEILSSRRFKHVKFIYSTEEQELTNNSTAYKLENVHQFLRD